MIAAFLASHFFDDACHYSKCSAGKLIILCYQILTDVNAELAQYKPFVCRKEKKFVHADAQDAHSEYKCLSNATGLEEVKGPGIQAVIPAAKFRRSRRSSRGD